MLGLIAPLLFAAAAAAADDSVTLGELHFARCTIGRSGSGSTTAAFCAPFKVKENRDAPEGREIDLKLALIRSDSATPASDIVVLLAGGPGQAATESYSQLVGALAPLKRKHHILLLDQRGTGGSHALNCKNDDKLAEAIVKRDFGVAALKSCLATIDADPTRYTTTEAVRDLEAVREQLGNPQFDLVGISYGTRMAQAYLRAHPDGVRSVVLDGVAPNELILGGEFAGNLDDSLKRQFEQCNKTPECAKRFGDPYKTLYTLRDRLRAQPQRVSIPDPQTFQPVERTLDEDTMAGLVRLFAYSSETAAILPLSLDLAVHGDYTPLLGQAKLLSGTLDTDINAVMGLSVICAEDADLLVANPQDAGLLLGTKLVDGLIAQCKVWPKGSRPENFHAPIQSDKPVLLLSGEYDPVTPPRYADQVLKGLGRARHLVAKGQGHNVIPRGCMPRLIGQFVDKLDPAALDAKCLDALGPLPAYLDFNGAAP